MTAFGDFGTSRPVEKHFVQGLCTYFSPSEQADENRWQEVDFFSPFAIRLFLKTSLINATTQ